MTVEQFVERRAPEVIEQATDAEGGRNAEEVPVRRRAGGYAVEMTYTDAVG